MAKIFPRKPNVDPQVIAEEQYYEQARAREAGEVLKAYGPGTVTMITGDTAYTPDSEWEKYGAPHADSTWVPCAHIVKKGKHTMMLAPLGTPDDMRSVVVVVMKDELFAGQHPMGPMYTFVPDLYCHPPTGEWR